MKTWKILDRDYWKPESTDHAQELICDCGEVAIIRTRPPRSPVIAALPGCGLIFNNPSLESTCGWLPVFIRCRKCKAVYFNFNE